LRRAAIFDIDQEPTGHVWHFQKGEGEGLQLEAGANPALGIACSIAGAGGHFAGGVGAHRGQTDRPGVPQWQHELGCGSREAVVRMVALRLYKELLIFDNDAR
jgi:hypothetical protein